MLAKFSTWSNSLFYIELCCLTAAKQLQLVQMPIHGRQVHTR